MQDREDIEAWADALIEQNRSAPPPPHRSPEARAQAIEELPPTWRFMIKHGHVDPDPDTIERVQRAAKRHSYFENLEAIVIVIGAVGLCLFLFSFYSSF